MRIKLIVVRTQYPEKLADFYSLLGLTFDYHKYGNSPYHYSAVIDGLIFEIYPFTKNQTEADKNLRLGFELDSFEESLAALSNQGFLISEPKQTDFGIIAIITDPDGRKIELYKSNESI
ncbi:VOC family protein [Emticicia sp. C21]|uniref:VOC family protein n=1 Tax=Emticicia sp. C21 TaxID=2302915 RepID=UPI000E34D2B9|nr:glyoxalase/bleomycin resistance/extradiol dioxygenase family protein [Emticicia sp. C21]RFS14449.1 glyoxalase/bleomycin resistance/extradiol dioxygenase family protein [Emticicia sp. C21]